MKLLNEIIEECIEANALFTVHDIIPEAKSRGCTSSNDIITEYVKNYRYPIFYTRTLKELDCEIIIPVYHPADKKVSEYDASDLIPTTSLKVEQISVVKHPINTDAVIKTLISKPLKSDTDLHTFKTQISEMISGSKDGLFTRKQIKECTTYTDYRIIQMLKQLESENYVKSVCGSMGSKIKYTLVNPTPVVKPVKKIVNDELYMITNHKSPAMVTTPKGPFDKRGRYNVKVSDVQKAGFEIGEKVNIMLDINDDTIVITNKRQSKRLHQVGAVKVDIYQNLSVAQSPFKRLNKNNRPIDLKLKVTDREIKIIPAY